MPEMIDKKCKHCKSNITVRLADHQRGWGNFCNKSCKAKYQTKITGISGSDYKASGMTVDKMRNGKYAKSKFSENKITSQICFECGCPATNSELSFDEFYGNEDGVTWSSVHRAYVVWTCDMHFDDTHPFSSDALGQW